MAENLFDSELLQRAKEAKSAEELLALAKEKGIKLTKEQAKGYFAQFNSGSGELSDDELNAVAGGGCEHTDVEYIVNNLVALTGAYGCPYCDNEFCLIEGIVSGTKGSPDCVYELKCCACGKIIHAKKSEFIYWMC